MSLSKPLACAALLGLALAAGFGRFTTGRATADDTPPAKAEKEPGWKAEFRKAYGLKADELVRRVAPPFPDCRAEHFRERLRRGYARAGKEPPAAELELDRSAEFTVFTWDKGWATAGWQTQTAGPDDGVSLALLVDMTLGVPVTRLDATDKLREARVTGDFVLRAGADREKAAAALERILRKECDLPVALAFADAAEEDVFVLSGRYEAKPLDDRQPGEVEVHGGTLVDRKTGGGGSGTLAELAAHLERYVGRPVVLDQVANPPKGVRWHDNARVPATPAQRAADRNPAAVLENVAAQTGLTVATEKRKLRKLVVTERE